MIIKVIALLTGRGNNSLKDKNIVKVLGKSVMHYPAHSAKITKVIDDWYCSSDDEQILSIARNEGYKTIVRPKEFSLPSSQHIDCIIHALNVLDLEKNLPDILVVLLANNVTIQSKWIMECVNIMKADLTITAVVPVYQDNDHHPLRAKIINHEGKLEMYIKNTQLKTSTNRQDLDPCYFLSHNFWILNVKYLLSGNEGQQPWSFMGNKIIPYIISESIDIHHEIDLIIASDWIQRNYID